ncbi:hypothetical protein HMPREF1860_02189 [Prevotella amnii]|uniref:Uncharacterized protein n=1 Tax=Prevotella amnii TaxID=419005 RepID=A0A134B2N4_9BACT|nr:hypothetical protein [Prevotella amnii]KXB74198.1 hypothetical protein HMPREF1860_02189 [Prevotella amnii]
MAIIIFIKHKKKEVGAGRYQPQRDFKRKSKSLEKHIANIK